MLGVMLAQSVRAMSYLAAGPGEGAGRVIRTLCALPGGPAHVRMSISMNGRMRM